MKTILFVMLQVILASGILYGYYHLMLRNKKFHQYNRFYLIASVIISVLIPFISIPVYFAESEIQASVVLQTLQTISTDGFESEVATTPLASPEIHTAFGRNVVLYLLYGLIALVLLIRILISLRKITSIIRKYPVEELNGVRFINTVEPGTPYSFFRWLFWNRKIELRSEKGEQIFRHEIFHIQQKHSVDIVFMELLTVVFWINPFFHLMKKEVKAIHEFLADQFAAHKTEKWEYAELLLMQALNTQQHLVNPFFHNQIKRRIAMITNPQKTSHRYLRKLLVLPVTALVLILFAFKYKQHVADPLAKTDEPITIVVDAGHGGIDRGAKSNDGKYTEAQVTLQIAKEIQRLGTEYNVKVLMTRQDDNLPGNAVTIQDGLKKRMEICTNAVPLVFISIHMNSEEGSKNRSGFEAAISGKKEIPASNLLASSFLQNISSVYKVNDKPHQLPEKTVFVLDKNLFPAVMLQCGYITNADDLAFITKQENQEKLARTILETIVKYRKQITSEANLDSGNDTLPKPHTKRSVFYSHPDKLILEADTLVFHPRANYKKIDFNKVLVIINGKKEATGILKENTIISKQITFYSKGDPETKKQLGEEAYNNGALVFEDAKIIKTPPAEFYKEDFSKATARDPDNIIFDKVEIEPAFPGGERAWKKILETTLNPSIPAQNHAPAGAYTVYIQFIVHTDGSISDIKALTNHGFGMEEEAKRIIENSPRWSPAIQNGRPVNAYKKQRIDFAVRRDRNQKTTMIERWLSEIVLVGYASSNPNRHIPNSGSVQSLSLTEGGSAEWRRFFERNLDPNAPIREGWAAGIYKILIQFTQNDDGTLSDINALTYRDSKTAEHCINMVKHVQKMLPQKNNEDDPKPYFVQPFTFQIISEKEVAPPVSSSRSTNIPRISISDLKKTTVYDLLNLVPRAFFRNGTDPLNI